MLYRCKDGAHGQPGMIYGNKDIDTAWKEEPELKGKSQPACGSTVVGLEKMRAMDVKD